CTPWAGTWSSPQAARTGGCPHRTAETVCRPYATVGPWKTPYLVTRILFSLSTSRNILSHQELLYLPARGARKVVDLVQLLGPLLRRDACPPEVVAHLVDGGHRMTALDAQHRCGPLAEPFVGHRDDHRLHDAGHREQHLL